MYFCLRSTRAALRYLRFLPFEDLPFEDLPFEDLPCEDLDFDLFRDGVFKLVTLALFCVFGKPMFGKFGRFGKLPGKFGRFGKLGRSGIGGIFGKVKSSRLSMIFGALRRSRSTPFVTAFMISTVCGAPWCDEPQHPLQQP